MLSKDRFGELFIWVTGRQLKAKAPNSVFVIEGYSYLWKCQPFGVGVQFCLQTAPNAIHRAMQRICFGTKYWRNK